MGVGAQVLAAGAAGTSVREDQGLPCARHGQFQPVPAGSSGPTAAHSWACQPRWRLLCENVFKKGQKRLEGKKRREQKE